MHAVRRFLAENGHLILIAAAFTTMHVLFNGQYGFHRDELDIVMNARRLDWGYVAYPPFTTFIARIGLELFGNSLRGLRFFSALSAGSSALLVGWMARDLGAGRTAQGVAALAAGIAPVALMAGTLIQYMAFDYLWWVVVAFCFVRLLATENPRWWLGVGAAIGMAMMTKYTAAIFVAGLAAGTLATRNRRYLTSGWLWVGAGLALLIFLPNMIWQVQHKFISLDFLNAIHERDIAWGRTEDFLPEQLFIPANPLTIPIWFAGLIAVVFMPSFKRFRSLGIAFLVAFGLFWALRGRAYYIGPAYPLLLSAGSAAWGRWMGRMAVLPRRITRLLAWALLSSGTLAGVILSKPVAPIHSELWDLVSQINGEIVEMIGWDDLTAQVAEIYTRLPEEDKPTTVILAGNYGEAGAFDLFGPEAGLPPVISGANSLWYRGYGAFEPQTAIVVGFEGSYALRFFKSCTLQGRVSNRYGILNEESARHTSLYVCRTPRRPWAEMWQEMKWFQ